MSDDTSSHVRVSHLYDELLFYFIPWHLGYPYLLCKQGKYYITLSLAKRFFRRRILPETSCLNYLLPEKKWSRYYEQITSSKDISITDCKNGTIQKNFFTTLFTPLPIILYNCCYNWCTGLFLLWFPTILLLLNIGLYFLMLCTCSMYVLCVSNPAVAAKSNKPLLSRSTLSVSIFNCIIVCPKASWTGLICRIHWHYHRQWLSNTEWSNSRWSV